MFKLLSAQDTNYLKSCRSTYSSYPKNKVTLSSMFETISKQVIINEVKCLNFRLYCTQIQTLQCI